MDLIGILITLVIIGVVLYLFNMLVTIDPKIKNIIYVLVCLFIFIWLLCALGLYCYHGGHV